MTDHWLCPDQLFDGTALRRGMALRVTKGKVTDVQPTMALGDQARPRSIRGLVTPGFVDLQVNGGGGVLFNHTPTRAGIAAIAAAHRRFGTVAIMPTVITDTPTVLAQAAMAAIAAHADTGVAGLHIEGPHIATARRGTHHAGFIRTLDATTINLVTDLRRRGIAVMITLAPEAASLGQITALATTGAIVSLGHTDATAQAAQAAFGAGARAVTHLFNAMSQMQGRAPGVVGAAINSETYAGLICDGIHVADEMLGLAMRARPVPDRMFLVSDAMPTVGGPDHFTLYDAEIRVANGRLINSQGDLAGAHVTQAQGVARLVQRIGIPLETALRMAITVPATLIGAAHLHSLIGRAASDVMLLDQSLHLVGTLSDHSGTAIDNHRA